MWPPIVNSGTVPTIIVLATIAGGISGKPDATPASKADKSRADSLPSSYEESPPHIMDHDYARPPATPEPFANDHGGYAKAPAPGRHTN